MEVNEWIEKYRPVKNHLDEDASWQGEDGVGVMFETYGEELDYVRSIAESDPKCVWTYVDGDDGSTLVINGYHLVNRIGYFVTEVAAADESVFVQVSEPDSLYTAVLTLNIDAFDAEDAEDAQRIIQEYITALSARAPRELSWETMDFTIRKDELV